MFVVVIIVIIALAFFYASYSISSKIYLHSLCCNRKKKEYVAITFDDGPHPIITPKVLDTLKKYNAKATFFIIGENAQRYPEIVKRIADEGHNIGNHSFYHRSSFPMQKTSLIVNEIQMCSQVLTNITGNNIKLFRPPYGVTNPMIAKGVKKTKMISIGWSIRSLDTIGQSLEKVKQRVIRQLKGGDIILLHDNRNDAETLLENIIVEIYNKDFKTCTINELFNV